MNQFGYLRSSPIARSDPLGLTSTFELGGVSGIQAMLGALLNGVASVGTSIGGLPTSGGIWAVNYAATGALVVGYNFDQVSMFASSFDSNWQNWVNNIGNSGGPQYDPKNMTSSESVLARDWGVTTQQVGDAIHKAKSGQRGERRHAKPGSRYQ